MIKKYSDYTIVELQIQIEKEMLELRKDYPRIYKYMEDFKLK
tara:strand:+ start:2404 stop:2529 length:126 start_codon:yes stop_codon:yes gene_type:complete